ncbi:fimbrial protein [Paraburkholderia sp. D15]|uniref:fimbrial protein n=1 Tax=Paraburkholderia sp. D15 TaxID=2880218 RepID=UPI0024793585|nr:fimbrial protein [Paraburkholderia sp. D15]WGS54653.1 fimbrial protein [Paraburkholderia sp. D15]
MSQRKWWFLQVLFLAVMAFGWTASARADCPTTGLPKTFNYGPIAVSNNLAVGDVIPGTVQSFTLSGKCSAGSLANQTVVACPSSQYPVSGTSDVYSTGLAGVGMRMRNSSGTPLIGSGYCDVRSSLGTTAADGSFNVSGTLELVKTGTITGGTITPTSTVANYFTGLLGTGVVLNNGTNTMQIANGTAIRTVTCSVTAATAYQTVPLATISPSMLANAGAVAAKTPFSLALNCDKGISVAITFTSASGASGIPSVLGSNGSASGVGVQLLDASQKPITLGTALPLTSSTLGNDSFPFYAQYYRLSAATVKAGRVNATGIFTMSYQ